MQTYHCDTLVIGAGIVGISTAYYLKKHLPGNNVMLVDLGQPMAFTSAQSGENYRNWWPHPVMTAFTDHSIDLMEDIARETENRIHMSRGGYALASRSIVVDEQVEVLYAGYSGSADGAIRMHGKGGSANYHTPRHGDWPAAPLGVDVLQNSELIRSEFPSFAGDIRSVVHIRRAGSISGQQMGQYMLEKFKASGGRRLQGKVVSIEQSDDFVIHTLASEYRIKAARVVNAAGPFINEIAEMLGTSLPVKNILQQKIAFEDVANTIPRGMPFSIDLDSQLIDWSSEEKELLQEDAALDWLTGEMPGAIHCRPDGDSWLKLGWAFNETSTAPDLNPLFYENFPEIVLRGAARLHPSLKVYYGQLPRGIHHYGGFYTMTEENWPLIGPMSVEGTFVVGAMSGFGTMAACAGGELCAQWVLDEALPDYAGALCPQRYDDPALMREIKALGDRGVL